MENMEIWGHFSIQSGKCSDEIVQILINAGFLLLELDAHGQKLSLKF